MLASVTSWSSGMVEPEREERPARARVELDLLLPDDVVPAHPHVGGAAQRHRVVDAHGDDGMAVLDADARDLPDRHAGDVDRVAVGQPGDVGQLRVDGVAAAEERDVADLDGQADEEDEADEGEHGELERGRRGSAAEQPHDDPPSSWLMMPPRSSGSTVGLADDAVDLVGRGGARAGAAPAVGDADAAGVERGGAAGVADVVCSALNDASSEEQLKAEPVPARACWIGWRNDIPPVGGAMRLQTRLLTSLKRMKVLK